MQHTQKFLILLTIALLIPIPVFFIIPVSAAGTETQITSNASADQENPSIYGDYITWVDSRNGIRQDIYLYNTVNLQETRITDGSAIVDTPDIQGSRVVWSQDGRDIFWYDIPTGQKHKVPLDDASRFTPRISGDRIVWTEQQISGSVSHNDILMYDIGTNLTYNLTAGQPDTDQEKPAISGTIVVWEDHRRDYPDYDIYGVDTSDPDPAAWIEKPVCTENGEKRSPAVSGDIVVWQDARTDYPHIYSAYFSTAAEIWNSSREGIPDYEPFFDQQFSPSVYENSVVWLDTWPDYGTYIGMYNSNSEEMTEPLTSDLTNIPSYDYPPHIYQNRIVWQDVRSGLSQIYLFTDGVSVTCPVADFGEDAATVSPGELVHFLDTSSPVPDTWFWEFGDGTSSDEQHPSHSYTHPGTYTVMLSVGNATCRSTTPFGSHQISVSAVPSVDFTASPLTGMAPLAVTFNGSSTGDPDTWFWEFGDGATGSARNITHVYATGGAYSVRLNATNTIGTGTKLRSDYIHVLSGSHAVATTPIDGITIENRFGGQFLLYDTGKLPDFSCSGPGLVSHPPLTYGWQNVTFLTSDEPGFFSDGSVISGNITGIIFQIQDIRPSGFSAALGTYPGGSFSATLPLYPEQASLRTDVWESATGPDNLTYQNIIHQNGFSSMNDLAYTMDIARSNFGTTGECSINLSVDADWIAGFEGSETGRNSTYVIATGYDSAGNYYGMVLTAAFRFHDPMTNLDYFTSDIPAQYSFLSRFSLAKLSGSGNPFQLVTLTLVSIINPDSDTGSDDTSVIHEPVSVQNTQAPELEPAPLSDTGKTARLYSNMQGTITQATTLQSADGLARIAIRKGIVAKDSTGAALSSITISSLPAENVTGIPDGSVFAYEGMAYELGPDGSTFSPAISLSFTIPQAQWERDYIIRTFDHATGVWEEVPTTYDPDTGVVNAEVSRFCCFALFSRTVATVPSERETVPSADTSSDVSTQPPTPTAMSTFTGMILWVVDIITKNGLAVAGAAILVAAVYLYGRKRRRDRILFHL